MMIETLELHSNDGIGGPEAQLQGTDVWAQARACSSYYLSYRQSADWEKKFPALNVASNFDFFYVLYFNWTKTFKWLPTYVVPPLKMFFKQI